MLAVLLPAILFYLLMTLVCLYFSFYSVSTEVRSRHIQEVLYTGAIIDTNIRELMLIGRSLIQEVTRNENENISQGVILSALNMLIRNNKTIFGFGIVHYNGDNKKQSYWSYDGYSIHEKVYGTHVSSAISGSVDQLVESNSKYLQWVTDPNPKNINEFHSSLLIPISAGHNHYVIHIDVDGDKLSSHNELNYGDLYKGIIKKKPEGDSRVNFSRYFTLRDDKGVTIFTRGKSAKHYRVLADQVLKMKPIDGASDFFSYEDLENKNLISFILKNRIKRLDRDVPNSLFLDLLEYVCRYGEIIHFRFSIRGLKLWCTAIPIKSSGWMLTAYMHEQTIMQPIYDQFIVCLMLSISAVLVVIISLWIVAGRIADPIKRLKKNVNLYVKAIEPEALFEESINEVDSLRYSFNTLTNCLDDRSKALYEARVNNISHLANQLHGRYFYFNLDCDGYITHVSPSIKSVLGYDVFEFEGKFENYLVAESVKNSFQNKLYDIFEGEWHDTFETKMQRSDGSICCIELFLCLMPGIKTKQKAIEGMANDITERVVDTEKFKSLLASAPDAVVISNECGIISLINNKVSELFGFMPDELINMPFDIIFPESSRASLSFLKTLATNKSEYHNLERYECFALKKNGGVFPVEISSSVISTEHGYLVSIVVRDISERKLIERELIKAKENAENSDKAKTLFLSNMSHELKTPLNGVLGYSQILINDGSLSEFHKNKVKSMEECGRHLLKLINNVLDMAKLENDKVQVEKKPFNLTAVIDEVRLIVINLVRNKGLSFQVDIDNNVPAYIVGDKLKIRQILINLIVNAVKFTDSGFVSISLVNDNGFIKFSVEDSGIGINDEDKDKLFVSFSQLAAGRKKGGAGLGLAISYNLVKIMGGELNIKSKVGEGSCFCFSLPCMIPTDEGPSGYKFDSCKQLSGNLDEEISLLVVESCVSSREVAVNTLSSAGFKVYQAADGSQALNLCRKYNFDLVLIDVKMPGLDGVSATKLIRKLPGKSDQKVIAITGFGNSNSIKGYDEAGFCDYLEKPLDLDDLIVKICGHLDYDAKLIEKSTVASCSGKVVIDHSVKPSTLREIVKQVGEMLEIGDVDAIANLAMNWQKVDNYGNYPEIILGYCENYDINSLEVFVKDFQKKS